MSKSKIKNPRSKTLRQRSGLSLLEVLISMGILLIGLSGVAAMFPAGQYYVMKAAIHDRGAAVGQAAINDLQVRGLLQVDEWQWVDTPEALPVVFDVYTNKQIPGFKRIRLPGLPRLSQTPGRAGGSASEYVFLSRDDIALEFPDDGDQPSRQIGFETDGTGTGLREFRGDYSWMFTVVPQPNTQTDKIKQMDRVLVSAAVFHKRRVRENSNDYEFIQDVQPAGGFGGGIVTFSASGNADRVEEAVQPGNWLMLIDQNNRFYRWYKVLSMWRNKNTGAFTLNVSGPDWAGAINPNATKAMLFTDVVAVYERSLPLERNNPWEWD